MASELLSSAALQRAAEDVGYFAEALIGEPLWPHQLEVARSRARYRVCLQGRQSGKSRMLSVIALHEAMRAPGRLILVVSAGEVASRRLLQDCASLALASPLLAGSVVDDTASVLTLDNGSTIRSVPASQAQIRGWAVDLLIIDEAAFIDPEVFRAAEPAIIARPGSRVILCSSPFGAASHFFRQLWHRGMDLPDEQVAAWHLPSSVSPLVDQGLLEEIRRRESPVYFAREYLAEWTESAGSYFTTEELELATADYQMIDLAHADGQLVVGGVDWGMAHDANTLALLGVVADGELDGQPDGPVYFVAHLVERFRTDYSTFIDEVIAAGRPPDGFEVYVLASETNGVGQFPTTVLHERAGQEWRWGSVAAVHTDGRRKESAFGAIKLLLQQGRLVLPRHPELLRQLAALEFEQTDAGNTRIAVPDRLGHDDLAMALAQAVSCIDPDTRFRPDLASGSTGARGGDVLRTGRGTGIHTRPRCAYFRGAFAAPRGRERTDGW